METSWHLGAASYLLTSTFPLRWSHQNPDRQRRQATGDPGKSGRLVNDRTKRSRTSSLTASLEETKMAHDLPLELWHVLLRAVLAVFKTAHLLIFCLKDCFYLVDSLIAIWELRSRLVMRLTT